MAAENWTAQLHIVDGVASEDALEIAYAERRDHRGRLASLYILAEPDRPGSEPFIGELVSRIGEEYLDGEGSLTGILQRVIQERHEELLDWNRTSLPRYQASYGLSCLVVREGDVFLMQMGPCLAYYRREGRLLRRRPSSEQASGALGSAEASAPEFSQLALEDGDWVLLISSAVATAVGEEAIGALRDSPAEDILPALYPKLRILPRVSALVVAPAGAPSIPAEIKDGRTDGRAPLDLAPAEPPAHTEPSQPREPAPLEPAPAETAPSREEYRQIPTAPTPVPESPVRERDMEPGAAPDSAPADTWREDGPDPYETLPERTSMGAGIGGFFSGLGGLFRRRPARDDPWAEAYSEDDFAVTGTRAPRVETDWDPSPVSDPEIAGGEIGPETGLAREDDVVAAGPQPAAEEASTAPDSSASVEAAADVAPSTTAVEEEELVATPDTPEIPPDLSRDAKEIVAEPNVPQAVEEGEAAGASDDRPPPEAGAGSSTASGSGATEASSSGGSGSPAPGLGGSVEYRLEHEDGHGPGTLEARAAGWPSNPFTTPAAPVLETGQDADRARFPRPMFALEGRMLRFRPRRKANAADTTDEPVTPGRGWGALALAVVAVVGVLAVVVGVLLIPDLLENSEQSRFEELVEEGRRGLTAASLTSDAAAGRIELTAAQTALRDALALRPLDESVLALQQEVTTALSQINAVVRPPDLVEVANLAGRVPPPLALSLVQAGPEALYMLDESGGRVFSLPLAGGEPEVIFEAGLSYPVLFLFEGPEAGAPVGLDWAVGAAGASLTILDANGRLFRFLPGEGVHALEMPNRELIGSPDAVAVDETGIFVLDVAGGSIWRFPQLSDATLLEPQPAIARTDLATAGSLATGESLFVAGANGRIRRFSDGVDQGFPLLDLDRPLLVPASLAVGDLTGLVYTVDRGNNRVAVFTPAGELVAQLRADELNGVRGVVPDEANGRLYFVTADALLTSTLPPIIGR